MNMSPEHSTAAGQIIGETHAKARPPPPTAPVGPHLVGCTPLTGSLLLRPLLCLPGRRAAAGTAMAQWPPALLLSTHPIPPPHVHALRTIFFVKRKHTSSNLGFSSSTQESDSPTNPDPNILYT